MRPPIIAGFGQSRNQRAIFRTPRRNRWLSSGVQSPAWPMWLDQPRRRRARWPRWRRRLASSGAKPCASWWWNGRALKARLARGRSSGLMWAASKRRLMDALRRSATASAPCSATPRSSTRTPKRRPTRCERSFLPGRNCSPIKASGRWPFRSTREGRTTWSSSLRHSKPSRTTTSV